VSIGAKGFFPLSLGIVILSSGIQKGISVVDKAHTPCFCV
jgi:hypothetical protein